MPNCRKCNVILTKENWYSSFQSKEHRLCIDCDRKRGHEYYLAHKHERYLYTKKWAETHRELRRHYVNEWRKKYPEYSKIMARKYRQSVLAHYGRKCECCGEEKEEFLAIHHKHGGGNKHRKSIGNRGGNAFYLWLIKHDYPEEFGILCHNCNHALGSYGYCPHKPNVEHSQKHF